MARSPKEIQFYHACDRCGRAIERKWDRCFVCRNYPAGTAQSSLPPPPPAGRVRNHRGVRTPNISTLN